MRAFHPLIELVLQASAWLQDGRRYRSPVRPDRILRVNPADIQRMPTKSPNGTIPPTTVAGGNWDRSLKPIADDVVYRSLDARFNDGAEWEETPYPAFLQGQRSEHGNLSWGAALDRCRQLDSLYQSITNYGYKRQTILLEEGVLLEDLTNDIRPPVYREVSVDITRDGEFVWHGGMHRLVIAKLLKLETIPVRINTRHTRWQEKRELAYQTGGSEEYADHPDITYLTQDL